MRDDSVTSRGERGSRSLLPLRDSLSLSLFLISSLREILGFEKQCARREMLREMLNEKFITSFPSRVIVSSSMNGDTAKCPAVHLQLPPLYHLADVECARACVKNYKSVLVRTRAAHPGACKVAPAVQGNNTPAGSGHVTYLFLSFEIIISRNVSGGRSRNREKLAAQLVQLGAANAQGNCN